LRPGTDLVNDHDEEQQVQRALSIENTNTLSNPGKSKET
jgi:hypothetical protein